jgi:tetratricopeptide (TPR) repeat protein
VNGASAEERIRYYSERVARSPWLYPMYTQLGLACLDRARETHDSTWLAKARTAEAAALALQDNFESLMAMVKIQNYAHRFADALRWGERAAAASVNGPYLRDPTVSAALVEAHLGLGQLDAAGKLVPSSATAPADFQSAAALGAWLAAANRVDDAVQAYVRASRLARDEGVADSAAWAEAAAAGALLQAGRPAAARVHVEAAAALAPRLTVVRLRRAQLAEADARFADALAIYETILHEDPDPAIAVRAYAAARRCGDRSGAARHFAEAEQGLERAISAGEVYTLGPLAQLYATAGTHLDRALALANENLKWKRDRDAVATVAAVQAQLAPTSHR